MQATKHIRIKDRSETLHLVASCDKSKKWIFKPMSDTERFWLELRDEYNNNGATKFFERLQEDVR